MKAGALIPCLVALALCLAPSGCVKPASSEKFIPAAKAQAGIYVFDFEMADTLSTYDFYFYTRVDGPQLDSLPLKVMWVAPSGESFTETVYMDPTAVMEPYRSGVRPAEAGDWRICVRPVGVSGGFRGLGLVCKDNGTR